MEEIPTKLPSTYWKASEHNLLAPSSNRSGSQDPNPNEKLDKIYMEIASLKNTYGSRGSSKALYQGNGEVPREPIRSIEKPKKSKKSGKKSSHQKRPIKEYSMKLDANPTMVINTGYNDNLNRRISELEFALSQEILKNEETQAMNLALKEMIENLQITLKQRGKGDFGSLRGAGIGTTLDSVKIREALLMGTEMSGRSPNHTEQGSKNKFKIVPLSF